MGSLIPKLGNLLMEEYNIQTSVKKDVESLIKEMKSMHTALNKVAEVPRAQLDGQVNLWADEIRELSYNMEDVVDKFLVRVHGVDATDSSHKLKWFMEKMANLIKKGKIRRHIAGLIKDINREVKEVAGRRDRNKVENIIAEGLAPVTIDPRLRALYTDVEELVGIYGKRDQELIKLLTEGGNCFSKKKLMITSIVGFGGLGKTTLAKVVYNKLKGEFDCRAFVPVGRNPDVKKVFRDILIDLGTPNSNLMIMDERQLIDKLHEFLKNKRYFIVIDDIWDKNLWEIIKLAFNTGENRGSRLITTTRIVSVSKACCSSTDDMIYEMKPLSASDSQMLFYRRIFSHECGCPGEFEEVSKDILKKCGGVPLAIMSIASLLVSDQEIKPKSEWLSLHQSIGRGLTEDASLEEMQRILSFSYYDLPSHLKTCLLYLTIYPEDCTSIYKDRLICKWVAESFIQCQKQGCSLFEIGEIYFNELINRSMIQPVYDHAGQIEGCRVHDMVLDLIRSLSSGENFVTLVDGYGDNPCFQARRLSLQNRNEDHQTTSLISSISTSQVRSITIFPLAINLMPPLSSFEVLRVLDLWKCNLGELNLKDVGKLFHLRYLGLAGNGIRELPAEIGNLQFLQVLYLAGNYLLKQLPQAVCKLRRLMFLHVERTCEALPDGLGNLTSMEVLKTMNASLNLNIVKELGSLQSLRDLQIYFDGQSLELEKTFVDSLCGLHNIRRLVFDKGGSFNSMDLLGERWVAPRHLRRFDSSGVDQGFSTLPAWIKRDPSHLSDLTELSVIVKEVRQEDMRILGRLPALGRLWMRSASTRQTERRLAIGADGFRCVTDFRLFCGPATQILFEQGALPRAHYVEFSLGVRVGMATDDANGDFDLGGLQLQRSLLSLRDVRVKILCGGGKAEKAEAAVRRLLHQHPNRPKISIEIDPEVS